MHSLGIVQWDSTRWDHPGKLGGVSGSGPVKNAKGKRLNQKDDKAKQGLRKIPFWVRVRAFYV